MLKEHKIVKSSMQKLGNARIKVALQLYLSFSPHGYMQSGFNYTIFSTRLLIHSVYGVDGAHQMDSYSMHLLSCHSTCGTMHYLLCNIQTWHRNRMYVLQGSSMLLSLEHLRSSETLNCSSEVRSCVTVNPTLHLGNLSNSGYGGI